MDRVWDCASLEVAGAGSQIPVPAVVKMQHGALAGNTKNGH